MKITVFCGYEYFCNKLVKQLSEYDRENKYIFANTIGFLNKLLAIYKIIIADNVFIIGGSIYGSKIINLALLFNKKIFIEWVGTDILIATENYNRGKVNREYIEKCCHLCEVDWTKEELKKIGIDATICDIVTVDIDNSNNNRNYNDHNLIKNSITVLSYIAKNREEFYGIDFILRLAELYPEINFRICGTDGDNYKHLKNVEFLGWIDNMNYEYDNCDIFMRLVQHDGLAFSVIEALSRGKWVIYSYPFNYVQTYNNFDDLKIKFQILLNKCINKQSNNEAVDFVYSRYNIKKVLADLVGKL